MCLYQIIENHITVNNSLEKNQNLSKSSKLETKSLFKKNPHRIKQQLIPSKYALNLKLWKMKGYYEQMSLNFAPRTWFFFLHSFTLTYNSNSAASVPTWHSFRGNKKNKTGWGFHKSYQMKEREQKHKTNHWPNICKHLLSQASSSHIEV